jgi:hypothetical protein
VSLRREAYLGSKPSAASALSPARRNDLAATGSSSVVSQSLLFSLTLLGLHVRFLPNSSEHGAAAAFVGPGDCLVAVSFSGRTRATVDAAARASKAGATVIVITCNRRGPILRHAGIAIVLDARQVHTGRRVAAAQGDARGLLLPQPLRRRPVHPGRSWAAVAAPGPAAASACATTRSSQADPFHE